MLQTEIENYNSFIFDNVSYHHVSQYLYAIFNILDTFKFD